MTDKDISNASDTARNDRLRFFAQRLGLTFRSFSLLDASLTHASSLADKDAPNGQDYEALEFLGDAVLQLAISEYLFERLPQRTPGDYTKLRAALVNRNSVAKVGKRWDIAPMIQLGKGEESGGGRKRIALIADCLEALIGAVYLDAGWPRARAFVWQLYEEELVNIDDETPTWDYKSLLQHYCQANRLGLPRFEVVRSRGPAHRKFFEVEVYVCDEPRGRGGGLSKKDAEQKAAREALIAMDALK